MMRATKLIAALMLVGFAGGAMAQTEFKSADVHNSDEYPTVTAVKRMGEILNKNSGGKYTIKVFNKGALGSERETLEQVKLGALAMTRVNISAVNSMCPKTQIPVLPFLFSSVEHLHAVLDGPVGDEIFKDCEAQGFIGLAYYDSGARSMYGSKPIKTVADMKGMKVRVQQSELWAAVLGAMGANPSPMPINEVYTALKTKLVDAAENNMPSYEGFKHYEAVKFYSKTEHSMAPEVLMFSKVIWDKLPPADQAMIRAAAKESVPYMRDQWQKFEKSSLAVVLASGSQINEVEKKGFQDAMAPVYAKFAGTPDMQRLVKAVQDTKVPAKAAAPAAPAKAPAKAPAAPAKK